MTFFGEMPRFGRYRDQLNAAGVNTGTARGFWGGAPERGEIVVTTWTDAHNGKGQHYIWRPRTNHGNLKTAWELGLIQPGTLVRAIMLRQQGNLPLGVEGRVVKDAALLPGRWRVAAMVDGGDWHALIERETGECG